MFSITGYKLHVNICNWITAKSTNKILPSYKKMNDKNNLLHKYPFFPSGISEDLNSNKMRFAYSAFAFSQIRLPSQSTACTSVQCLLNMCDAVSFCCVLIKRPHRNFLFITQESTYLCQGPTVEMPDFLHQDPSIQKTVTYDYDSKSNPGTPKIFIIPHFKDIVNNVIN